jgi:peptide deformylase
MYAARDGMGLAASQVGISKRVFVIDTQQEGEQGGLRVFINPVILRKADTAVCVEGCLSLPGIGEPVQRAGRVAVQALDRAGRPFVLDAEGLLAVAIQHEYDHLEGVLFIDHLSHFVRDRVKRKIAKQQARQKRVDHGR